MEREIFKYYDTQNISYKKKETPQENVINFFSYLYRLIPVCKRNVHLSDALKDSPYIEVLKKYECYFKSGKDMNIYLSQKTHNANAIDFLQSAWNIYHLHLNIQMTKKRSNLQLLCIINSTDVYFIDVIKHPNKFSPESYFDIRYLEIIERNNWLDKIGFTEIVGMKPNSMSFKINESKDIFSLYTQGINIGFEFNGKGYMPLPGISAARNPISSVFQLNKISHNIDKISNCVKEYIDFHFENGQNNELKGMIVFKSYDDKTHKFDVINS